MADRRSIALMTLMDPIRQCPGTSGAETRRPELRVGEASGAGAEAGNMLAKELSFVAHAEAAGLALGAAVPIILTSRADDEKARLASCAVAALHRAWRAGADTRARLFAPAAE